MEIEIDIRKSIFENIDELYKKIKKLKEKIQSIEKHEIKIKRKERITEWYEKFRYFFTSNNFLLIAGKDAVTNEILIKKYLEKNDLVFHADRVQSPFGILKNGQNAKEEDILEAAKFVASYSKGWKLGFSSLEVFYVYPDQVSKKAPSGEYLAKGAFMIYGEKNYLNVKLEIAIGFNDKIIPGVPESVSKKTNKYVILVPGNRKPLDIAKELSEIFYFDENYILKFIPGNSSIIKIVK